MVCRSALLSDEQGRVRPGDGGFDTPVAVEIRDGAPSVCASHQRAGVHARGEVSELADSRVSKTVLIAAGLATQSCRIKVE
jgi:hypothetical protein